MSLIRKFSGQKYCETIRRRIEARSALKPHRASHVIRVAHYDAHDLLRDKLRVVVLRSTQPDPLAPSVIGDDPHRIDHPLHDEIRHYESTLIHALRALGDPRISSGYHPSDPRAPGGHG